MIPKQAIEKAIEGGYLGGKSFANYRERSRHIIYAVEDCVTPKPTKSIPEIALDPSFWQSLGKALGWGSFYDDEGMGRYHVPMLQGWYPTTTTASGQDNQAWQGVALYFYDLILTGQPTDKFWSELLNV